MNYPWIDLFLAMLLICLTWVCLAARYQKSVTQSSIRRGLSFCGMLSALGAALFLLHFADASHMTYFSAALWMSGIALVCMLICALLERRFSLRDFTGADALARSLGQAAAGLLSWLPLPEEPEPEKEIVVVPGQDSQEVLENAIELSDKDTDEICTHRSEVITLSLKDSPSKWRQTILENRHTYYPISDENEDDIIGVLDTRDYFRLGNLSLSSIMQNTVDKPWFVAENMPTNELIRQMKQKKTYFAIVLDEYGGMTGIVTLHDILEEILGEMADPEDARRSASIVRLPRNTWRISGSADLDDVSRALGEKLELDDFETFSGYILGTIGYIPEDDTQLEVRIGDLDIQIKSVKNHRIRQTLVRKRKESDPSAQTGTPVPKEKAL